MYLRSAFSASIVFLVSVAVIGTPNEAASQTANTSTRQNPAAPSQQGNPSAVNPMGVTTPGESLIRSPDPLNPSPVTPLINPINPNRNPVNPNLNPVTPNVSPVSPGANPLVPNRNPINRTPVNPNPVNPIPIYPPMTSPTIPPYPMLIPPIR